MKKGCADTVTITRYVDKHGSIPRRNLNAELSMHICLGRIAYWFSWTCKRSSYGSQYVKPERIGQLNL